LWNSIADGGLPMVGLRKLIAKPAFLTDLISLPAICRLAIEERGQATLPDCKVG
jgi:hypothetical protein